MRKKAADRASGTGVADKADGSFETRLAEARRRQGLEAAEVSAANAASPWGPGMRAGIDLVSAMVVAVVIGWLLDHWLHTLPLFLGIFVLLGGAAGVLNVWRVYRPRGGPATGAVGAQAPTERKDRP